MMTVGDTAVEEVFTYVLYVLGITKIYFLSVKQHF
jgi:hypothetical protein